MRITKSPLLVLVVASLLSSLSFAVTPDRISNALTGGRAVKLTANVHRKALLQYDQGPVDPAMRLSTMTLLTVPTASQQRALRQLVAEQQDSTSSNYQKWLTPERYADGYGLSQNDVQKITAWLKAQGFSGIQVARARNWISFNGSAAQVQSAFGTEIRRYNVDGELHYANSSAPTIPAAWAGVVTAIRGLTDFRPRPMGIRGNRGARPYYNSAAFGDLVAPGDIAAIYDIKPLYSAGIDGTGEKLAVAGQTDVYLADLADFRSGFGLSAISCTTNASGVITSCNDPHFQYVLGGAEPGVSPGDVSEADLDLEWSGATARNAQIIYVNSNNAFGSYYYAIDQNLAPVISLSYGLCELDDAGFVGSDEAELTLGNAQGITIVNSSGDSGAAQCDYSGTPATGGLSVSYPSSSPEVTGVGGTNVPLGEYTATYWGTTNGTDGGTALGYIPEGTWNDDETIGQFCIANPTNLFCTQGGNTPQVGWIPITSVATAQADLGISSTGGGPSNCATTNGGGVCTAGFAKPAYQTVTISGQASARFTPDVSLLASPNFPGYVFCTQLSELGISGAGSSCANGITNSVDNDGSIIGGTSASAPVFAGIVTLLNQYLAGPNSPGLGNINAKLYVLAKTASMFNKVNSGDNIVFCTAGTPANQPVGLRCPGGGSMGYLASNSDATTGYNLVTGLGSPDVNNLAIAWSGSRTATTVLISASPTQINQGQNVTFTATVSSASALGNVSFFNNGSTTPLGSTALTIASNGVATFSTTNLPGGTNNVTATYNGDGLKKPSTTVTAATVMVLAPDFNLGLNKAFDTVVAGHALTNPVTVTVTPVNGYNQPTTFSCATPPSGVTCAFSPNPVTPNGTNPITSTLTISTSAGMATGAQPAFNISATNGASISHTSSFTLTVDATDQSFTIADTTTHTVTRPASVSATLTLTPTNGFNSPVTYTCADTVAETTCTGPTGPTTTTSPQFTITTTAPTRAMALPANRNPRLFYAMLLPGLLGVVFAFGSRQRSLRGMRVLGLIMVLGVSTMWMGACGGGGGGGTHDPGTPTGPQSVTINATTGGPNALTATTTINFTVN